MTWLLRKIRVTPTSRALRLGFCLLLLATVVFVALPLEMRRLPKSAHDKQEPTLQGDFNFVLVTPTMRGRRRLAGQSSNLNANSTKDSNIEGSPLVPTEEERISSPMVTEPAEVVEEDREDGVEATPNPPNSHHASDSDDVDDIASLATEPESVETSDSEPTVPSKAVSSACPKLEIKSKFKPVTSNKVSTKCKPHQSPEKACVLAAELYTHREQLETCTVNRKRTQICKITKVKVDKNFEVEFSCDPNACSRSEGERIAVFVLDKESGDLKKEGEYKDSKELQIDLPLIASTTQVAGFNFVFLDCISHDGDPIKEKSQLLLLPTRIPKKKKPKAPKPESKITFTKRPLNVNVILIDSVSRAHFYRSLPKTLKTFNELNSKATGGEILDFELFQAVDGHSAENGHALFNGKLMPRELTASQKEGYPVSYGTLLKVFKDAGYHTTYTDDLCWHEVWGLRLDLGNPNSFTELLQLLEKNQIDDTGLTFASCKILKHNGVSMPFNGPDNDQICYNGRFEHQYNFQYLINLFSEHPLLHGRAPRIAYTILDTAHDYTGRRIQTMDRGMSEFVRRSSQLKNTLTIFLADHGNTYAEYTHAVLEGRYEMYHPSFFMIVPEGVRNALGKKDMNALRVNQKRLFSMIDLHFTLKTIALEAMGEKSPNRGLLDVITPQRSCTDMALNLPNLCVCDGWDTETHNDTGQVGVVDFAVGHLNNLINKQRYAQYIEGKDASFPTLRCRRLVPTMFTNVRERNVGEYLITSFDFNVLAGEGAKQEYDTFHVEVESFIHPKHESRQMKLLNYDRISQYGKYRACVDKRVNVKLCVCDITNPKAELSDKETLLSDALSRQIGYADVKITIEHKMALPCLYHIIRIYEDKEKKNAVHAAGFEVLNVCKKMMFKVTVSDKGSNVKYSANAPMEHVIGPFGVTYIGTALRDVPYWSSSIETTFSVA